MPWNRDRTLKTIVRGPAYHDNRCPTLRSMPRRQRNFIVVAVSVAVLILAFNAILLASDHSIHLVQFIVVQALFAAIALTPGPKMSRGSEFAEHKFWEFPIIFGLALAPVYEIITTFTVAYLCLCGVSYVTNTHRRPRALMRFGVLTTAVGVGVPIAGISEPWTYPVGIAVVTLLYEALLFGYDLAKGDRDYARRAALTDLGRRVSIPIASSFLLAAIVYAIGPERWSLFILPTLLLLSYWGVDWAMTVAAERDAWKQMESVSAKFIGEHEEHKAITAALEESLRLFSALRAELILTGNAVEDGSHWSLQEGPGERVSIEPLPASVEEFKAPKPTRNSAVIPLSVSDRPIGYLVIEWDPFSPQRRARQALTNTFGNAVAASLANTRHNKYMHDQAVEKAREAERDPLTGLGNRTMLSDQGHTRLAESEDIGRKCALLLFDLDGFKRINDTLGHAAGDVVLVEVGRRIRETVRKNDLAIRLGGDEFAVLAVDLELPTDAERLASKLTAVLGPPVEVSDLHLSVESSIGVAIFPDDARDIETLLRMADIAMYEAKSIGRGMTQRYDPRFNSNSTESLRLNTELRDAIYSRDQLVLHYQPQVNVHTGEVVGVEALVRWNHPEMGLLYPDRFVPLAERSNLIRPFTLAILRRAIADRAAMRPVLPHGTVSVNLSAQNLLDTGMAGDVAQALRDHDVRPEELVLEVTETTAAKDLIAAERVLKELSDLGCAIAMDDFGSGYATMESLRSEVSPISEIKIDRGFIKDITCNERDHAVAKAIFAIAHAYGSRIVAEGVEDEETFLMLRELDCDVAQGYWLHKPAALCEIMEWVKNRDTAVPLVGRHAI